MSRNNNPDPFLFFQPSMWRFTWVSFSRLMFAVVLLFAVTSTFAQDAAPKKPGAPAGSIHGTVTTIQDNTPSGVAGISVKLSGDPLQGTPLSTDTDEHGGYEFQNLSPGTYPISITLQGFKAISEFVVLALKQQLVQDFTLELDVVAEKVEVNK